MNDRTLIIWGAGNFGRAAFTYYSSNYKNIFYVDSNSQKWGDRLNGAVICNPGELDFSGCDVVIASKHNVKEIEGELRNHKGVHSISLFTVNVENLVDNAGEATGEETAPEKGFVVNFSGGFGNQLFEYAFLRNLLTKSENTYACISDCGQLGSRDFEMNKAFKNLKLKLVPKGFEESFLKKAAEHSYKGKFVIYSEDMARGITKKADDSIIDAEGGVYSGTFQTSHWADKARKELLSDLRFNENKEPGLARMIKAVWEDEYAVSIHFRRGDYLTERNKYSYGGICTEDYYRAAMERITYKIKTPHFYVFSDDIEYVKENYDIPNAVFIERNMFDDYEDWYDMCLMSKCRNNIIANSTFSWWGAWLNAHKDKIVIAPEKWINTYSYEDIYPDNWIRM